jgi:hypothetical protein
MEKMENFVNVGKVKELLIKFIDSNIDEFEFIVDINNEDYWEINFEDRCINLIECCSIYIREIEDDILEKYLNDDEFVMEKVKDGNFIYYIMI